MNPPYRELTLGDDLTPVSQLSGARAISRPNWISRNGICYGRSNTPPDSATPTASGSRSWPRSDDNVSDDKEPRVRNAANSNVDQFFVR